MKYTDLHCGIFLLAVFTLFTGCDKNIVAPYPTYTQGIGGVRNWHGYYYDYGQSVPGGTYYNVMAYYPDTSLAVVVQANYSINVFGYNFPFEDSDHAKGVIYFGSAKEFLSIKAGQGVAYYYHRDSIMYFFGDNFHGSEQTGTVYYTY